MLFHITFSAGFLKKKNLCLCGHLVVVVLDKMKGSYKSKQHPFPYLHCRAEWSFENRSASPYFTLPSLFHKGAVKTSEWDVYHFEVLGGKRELVPAL